MKLLSIIIKLSKQYVKVIYPHKGKKVNYICIGMVGFEAKKYKLIICLQLL